MDNILLFLSIVFTMVSATTKTTPVSNAKTTMPPKDGSKFWDNMADGYAKQPISDQGAYDKKLALTRKYLTKKSNVFEFGCGTGSTALAHAPFVKSIYATDYSTNMIAIAQSKTVGMANNVKFEAISIDHVSISAESMDAVLGLSILHLMPDYIGVIRKAHAMLKPGGVLVTNSACMGELGAFPKWMIRAASRIGVIPKLHIFSIASLRKAMTENGFEIVEEYTPGRDDKDSKSDKFVVFLVVKKKF